MTHTPASGPLELVTTPPISSSSILTSGAGFRAVRAVPTSPSNTVRPMATVARREIFFVMTADLLLCPAWARPTSIEQGCTNRQNSESREIVVLLETIVNWWFARHLPFGGEQRDLTCRGRLSKQLACVGGTFSGVFVLAIGVNVDALVEPRVEALPPGAQLLWRIFLFPKAQVSEIRGQNFRRRLLVRLGQAKRDVILAEGRVGFLGVPGCVTHLESKGKRRRSQRQEFFEQWLVEFECRRKLDKDRPQVVALAEHTGDLQEALQSAFAVAEPQNVCDLLIGFEGEAKTLRDAFGPLDEQLLGRHAIEAVIDFDCLQLLRIVRKHLAIRELRWVETTLPLFVGVP